MDLFSTSLGLNFEDDDGKFLDRCSSLLVYLCCVFNREMILIVGLFLGLRMVYNILSTRTV